MMNDLHNKTIDVLKGFVKARDEGQFPKQPYAVSTIINIYYNFTDHKQFEKEIAKTIVTEWKLGEGYADGLIDLDWPKTRKFLDPYDKDQYILDRCFDSLLKESSSNIDVMLSKQQVKLDRQRSLYLAAKVATSGLVSVTNVKMAFEYLFILKPEGKVILTEFTAYSDYLKDKDLRAGRRVFFQEETKIPKPTQPDLPLADKPTPTPAKKNKSRMTTVIQKSGLWIISNIWQFIFYVGVAVVAAIIIYYFKIPH